MSDPNTLHDRLTAAVRDALTSSLPEGGPPSDVRSWADAWPGGTEAQTLHRTHPGNFTDRAHDVWSLVVDQATAAVVDRVTAALAGPNPGPDHRASLEALIEAACAAPAPQGGAGAAARVTDAVLEAGWTPPPGPAERPFDADTTHLIRDALDLYVDAANAVSGGNDRVDLDQEATEAAHTIAQIVHNT